MERRPEGQHEYNAFLQKRRHEIEEEHNRLLSAFLIITKNKISNKTLLIFHARTVQTDIHRTSINNDKCVMCEIEMHVLDQLAVPSKHTTAKQINHTIPRFQIVQFQWRQRDDGTP